MLADFNDRSSDDRRSGKPMPPWRADAEAEADPDDGTVTAPEPARVIPKALSTLATELRELIFRDRKSRARHDR